MPRIVVLMILYQPEFVVCEKPLPLSSWITVEINDFDVFLLK